MGGLTRSVGLAVLLLVWLPALALIPALAVDRGPDGGPRLSPLPLALAVLDPFNLACLGHSVAAAAASAAGALVVGVAVGTITSRRRFWGRPIFAALVWVPWAAGPVAVAAGIGLILGGDAGARWAWLDARSILGMPFSDLARWLGLAGVGAILGVPVVAATTAAAWGRFDPTWAEAARAVGASRVRIARDLAWPLLRPEVARAVAAVFALALAEPAGPILLDRPRTLAAQIVAAAGRDAAPTRAATLAALLLLAAWAGRLLIGWWGGASVLPPDPDRGAPPPRAASAGRRRGYLLAALLAAWVAVGLAPVVAVLGRAVAAEPGEGWREAAHRLLRLDPNLLAAWSNGLGVGAAALLINGLALMTLFGRPGRPPGAVARGLSSALGWFPPLVLAVGGLALPWLVGAAADALPSASAGARWLGRLALELNPGRSPGFALIVAAAAATLPTLARAATLARRPGSAALVDAAITQGAGRRRAERDRDGHPARRVPAGPAALALALAATSVAPALLLTPLPERRTPGPDLLRRVERHPAIDGRVAVPLAAITLANLAAVGLAARGRAGRRGEWFRGG